MKILNKWLASLLGVQLLVAGALLLGNQSNHSSFEPQPLLSFDVERIDKVVVHGDRKERVITQKNGQWILPASSTNASSQLPAAEAKLKSALEGLVDAQTRWPVSTTSSSRERFSVTDDKFERKLELFDGENKLATLYIGSSAGFKQSHVRLNDDDEVYALEVNAYDYPTGVDDWLDKSLFAVNNVHTIKAENYQLNKAEDEWQLDPQALKEKVEGDWQTNVEKAAQLSTALGNFKVRGLLEDTSQVADATWSTFTVEGDETRSLSFAHHENKHYVKEQGQPDVFTLSSYEFNRVAGVNTQDLIIASNDSSQTEEGAQSDQSSSSLTSEASVEQSGTTQTTDS